MVPAFYRWFLAAVLLLGVGGVSLAQSFEIEPTQLRIVVAPKYDHTSQSVAISGTAIDFDFSALYVSSDAGWVEPTIDREHGAVLLRYRTAALTTPVSTATITVSGPGSTDTFTIQATVPTLNLVKLEDDPVRSRVYGLQQTGTEAGCVIAYDPIANQRVACVTVGKRPTDLAVSRDGSELLAINSVDQAISVVDLATLTLKATIALPAFGNSQPAVTTADVAYGPGAVIYYTDGAEAPMLRVLDRTAGTVLQSVVDGAYGIGDFALSPDASGLVAWAQNGWGSTPQNSYALRYTVDAQGRLTFAERTPASGADPIGMTPHSPVVFAPDGEDVYVKQIALDPAQLTAQRRALLRPVYSVSPGSEVVATDSAIHDAQSGLVLTLLPSLSGVQTMTNDSARLVYFNPNYREIATVDLPVGGRGLTPANGAITLAPASLQWPEFPGAVSYRVFLGTAETEVRDADTGSALYLGDTANRSFSLPTALQPGTQYFWRVDAVYADQVQNGFVRKFTVSRIATDLTAIRRGTVVGQTVQTVEVRLEMEAGLAWEATANATWITFDQSSGTGPGTLKVNLNASQLTAFGYAAAITLKTGGVDAIKLPVSFQVDTLAVTLLKTDPNSSKVYALTTGNYWEDDYLLEVDTATQTITRTVYAGRVATDFALHAADGRIYVADLQTGLLRAIDVTTFREVKAFQFSPQGTTGLGLSNLSRVSAGAAGRVMVESAALPYELTLFDTQTGKRVNSQVTRLGGGGFGDAGRFYFHGDNTYDSPGIQKYDVAAGVFTKTAESKTKGLNNNGSRTVVVTANGNRVFWNGLMFNGNLAVEWSSLPEVISASADGRYAFSKGVVFDAEARRQVAVLPMVTEASAYNSETKRLVMQQGAELKYHALLSAEEIPGLTVSDVNPQYAKVSWTVNSLATVIVQYRAGGNETWQYMGSFDHRTTNTTASSLDPETAYQFRIRKELGSEVSAWSEVVTITTPALPVPILAVQSVETHAVVLNWTNAASYLISFQSRLAGTTEWRELMGRTSSNTTYRATQLLPQTAYEFRIKSIVGNHESGWSNIVVATTGVVPVPVFTIGAINHRSVQLSWTDSHESGFTLQMRVAGTEAWSDVAVLGFESTSYTVGGLKKGTSYEFRINAQSGEISSEWSSLAIVTTAPPPKSKLIYKLTGKFQQLGDGATVSLAMTGHFVWDPETFRGVQIIALGPAKVGFFYVYDDTFQPRSVTIAKGARVMIFPSVGASSEDLSSAGMDANFLRGTAANVKIGTETFFAPRVITGKGWAVSLPEDGSLLLDTTETYSLDTTGTAASNKAQETVDQVVARLTQKLREKGYDDLSE